ncbi:hypothetical protein KL937_004230 [Ogataea polymorpha]|nr:hypothetical protein KL937_004230 [Ogataea polymorpha]KAG7932591.1 hypothetical protein KL904_004382 [Ogataea polymorpha]
MMLRHVLRRVFPFGVLLYLLYVQYAYCYVVCKQNIYDSGWHAAGVGLIVGEAVLVVLLLASWALMFVAGPGSLPVAVPPYNLNSYYANGQLYVRGELDEKSPSVVDDAALIAPPQIFLCNADGLPFWCAQCRSIKTLRAHHSSAHGRCIPRFDHYCLYIGTIVAQNNYVWFLCFVSCFEMLFFYILVSTFAFSKAVLSYGRHRILHPAALLMIHRLSAAQQGPAVQIHAWLTPVKTEKHSIPSQNYQRRGPHRAPQLPAVRQRRASGRTQRPRRAAGAGNSPSL